MDIGTVWTPYEIKKLLKKILKKKFKFEKKIIIFGGSGFIGKNLAQRLIKKDFLVTVVSRNKSIKFNLKNKNLEYLNCDITNINNIKKKLKNHMIS